MNEIFPNSVIDYICYHGTDVDKITELDKSKIQKDYRNGDDSGYLGWGFYLTKNKKYASEYGENVLEFFVDITNPFIVGSTQVDLKELVSYLFSNSKEELYENVQNSLETIKILGRGFGGDFNNNISNNIKQLCRELYIRYKNKPLNNGDYEKIKQVMILLADDSNNWLNGLFFYFGKQLFHYFTKNKYDGVIANDGDEIVVYETKQIFPINKNNIEEDLDLDTSEELIPLGSYWFNVNKEDRNLCGKTIYNSKTKKYGVVNSCGYQFIDVIYKGNKSSTRYYIWRDDSVTTTNDSVVTNNIFIAPHINWKDKFEEDLELEPSKSWADIKVGDKFKIIENGDICTITEINKNWLSSNSTYGECWLIDYKYDNHVGGNRSGSFKYWPDGENEYINTRFMLLN